MRTAYHEELSALNAQLAQMCGLSATAMEHATRALLVRTGALALLGVYLASKLVPAEAQTVVADLVWARDAGWLILALMELSIAIWLVRLVFGGTSAEEIAAKTGENIRIARFARFVVGEE